MGDWRDYRKARERPIETIAHLDLKTWATILISILFNLINLILKILAR